MMEGGDAGATLGSIVSSNARRFPDVVAYRDGERQISHLALYERAVRLASAMAKAGLRRQDRVVLLGQNSIEFGEVLAAAQLSGIVVATLNWRWSVQEMRGALGSVSPALVFCDGQYEDLVFGDGSCCPAPVVSFGEPTIRGIQNYEAFIARGGLQLPFTSRPDDLAYLLFTSGTTGGPKCCMIGHREYFGLVQTANHEMRTGSDDRVLINMPLCHIGALAIAAAVHIRGGGVVLQRQFDPAAAVRLISAESISVLHLAPVMLRTLLDTAPRGAAFEEVRTVVYSAAPIAVPLLLRALEALPSADFVNMYGQSEGFATALPPELHDLAHPELLESVGFPCLGTEVRVVDDAGGQLPVGIAGEIAIRSKSLFRGYWNDHAATSRALRDGWYYTGDVGRLDERGLLYLVDRKKDVIISGGENVYSPEVENAVNAIDGVGECAVVGVPDEQWGEVVCAVVVARGTALVDLPTLQEATSKTLARYKIPRKLLVVDELPRMVAGKVDKKRLRADLARRLGTGAQGPTAADGDHPT